MPTLAKKIVDMNQDASDDAVLNFKGFAVGNPFTTTYSGIPARLVSQISLIFDFFVFVFIYFVIIYLLSGRLWF